MQTDNFFVKWTHCSYMPHAISHAERDFTTCSIQFLNNPFSKIITASVGCSFKDKPNRKIGNREAFKKAVNQINDKSLRTELWGYFKKYYPTYIKIKTY